MASLRRSGSDALRCLSSPLFTFAVGADKKEVTVLSSALAGLSGSLSALINIDTLEAKPRHVDWSEVEMAIFARLCEFAYLCNYTPPSFRLVDDMSPSRKVTRTAKEIRSAKSIARLWTGMSSRRSLHRTRAGARV